MSPKNLPLPVKLAERRSFGISGYRVPIILVLAVSLLCLMGVKPAFAGELKILWLALEACKFISALEFWGFLGFIAFVPLSKMILGVVITLGGAFLPDIPVVGKTQPISGSVEVNVSNMAKVNFKGTPRYAVLAVGILIVISSLWDGASEYALAG